MARADDLGVGDDGRAGLDAEVDDLDARGRERRARADEALVIATLRKSVKNLSDARAEFEKGGRADLVAANDGEIKLLEKYLPQGLDAAKVEALIDAAIREAGAVSKKDMGKVIGLLKKSREAGLLDFGQVSKTVQAKLPA